MCVMKDILHDKADYRAKFKDELQSSGRKNLGRGSHGGYILVIRSSAPNCRIHKTQVLSWCQSIMLWTGIISNTDLPLQPLVIHHHPHKGPPLLLVLCLLRQVIHPNLLLFHQYSHLHQIVLIMTFQLMTLLTH